MTKNVRLMNRLNILYHSSQKDYSYKHYRFIELQKSPDKSGLLNMRIDYSNMHLAAGCYLINRQVNG